MRCPVDDRLAKVVTPLDVPAWKKKLESHPDKEYTHYLLNGMQHGFHIGADETATFISAKKNMLSATQNPEVIEDYLRKETGVGNILGPFQMGTAPNVHINRFGVIPKKYQPGKWRLITDLSFPENASINDAIDPDLCSMSYITVEQVAARAISLGKGSLIAKIDVKSAYRLIPVCPRDRKWLGIRWNELVYIDGMLPFGLRSAPKIFNVMADGLEWCVAKEGVKHIFHYLDDFAVLGPPDSAACLHDLQCLMRICAELGIPLALEKIDGPTATITFLGIIIDTIRQELRLPEEKLHRLLEMLSLWSNRKSCTRRELESFIGVLQHACKVIQPGKSFLRHAISLLSVAKKRHYHIRLNAEFRSDLMWWRVFAKHWNGASLLITNDSRECMLTSDASGSWGCGAWYNDMWFQSQWEERLREWHIAAKELTPILIASIIWGKEWKGAKVTVRCDNAAVVAVINSRSCRDKVLMQMLRCLFFAEAHFQFKMMAIHLPGIHNELADDLSRNRLSQFLAKLPKANKTPTNIPSSLLQWLLHPKMDWTSPSWMELFSSSVHGV